MDSNLKFLQSDLAGIPFGFKGQLGEASKAIEPILQALEGADCTLLPSRISKPFRKQLETEIDQLRKAGLKRVIRITAPKFLSSQGKGGLGFLRWVDASREWRECELTAAVLDRYIDVHTGACVIERYDEAATITLRQSRHIKASDQRRAKGSKGDVYVREECICPSCGAELSQIADRTNCPYCGAYITFHFFDWQLDSFFLDMRKDSLLEDIKETAKKASAGILVGAFQGAGFLVELFAGSLKSKNANDPNKSGYNYTLSAVLTVILLIVLMLLALPWYIQAALGCLVLALIARIIIQAIKDSEQSRKKTKIVRYSDAFLRSCIYEELWKDMPLEGLIDFSIDEVRLERVENTEQTTTVEVTATVIRKQLLPTRSIALTTRETKMTLRRARYPERKKSRGKRMEEKECPNCGANFSPDENHCCSYCGYGLKMENYVWRRVDAT